MTRRLIPGGWRLEPFQGFRGLNLREQPDGVQPAQALDLMNVMLADHGSLRPRDGYSTFDTADRAAVIRFLTTFVDQTAGRRLIESSAADIYAVDTGGAQVHTVTGVAGPVVSAARIGLPGAQRLYMGMTNEAIRRYDAAGFSAPTATLTHFDGSAAVPGAMPKGACVAVWPGEERLMVGGFPQGVTNAGPALATSSPDHVWVSANANPEAFRDTDFMRLGVGDGELMTGIASWRDLMFIFKESKYWVVTNTTPGADGSLVINRRNVDTGIGAVGRGAVTVGRDGVYFVGRRGIYRTRGGDPELLTNDVEPLWGGLLAPYYTGGLILQTALPNVRLQWMEEQLFMSFASTLSVDGLPDRVLVLDPRDGRVSIWALRALSLGVFRALDHDELLFGHATSPRVRRQQRGMLLDDGAPFKGFWQGSYAVAHGDRVTRCGGLAVYGQGTVDISLAHDYQLPTWSKRVRFALTTDTWGDGTNPADKWAGGTTAADKWGGLLGLGSKMVRRATRGARFAVKVAFNPATAGEATAWSINRVVLHFTGDPPRNATQVKE